MPDMEKVIKGLEVCRDQNNPPGYRFTSCVDDCPYNGNGCARKLKDDALAMLKEQEPVEPEYEGDARSTWWWVCGECHTTVEEKDKFCRECGRRILWGK